MSSFENGYESENKVLKEMKSNWSKLGTHLTPSVVVNDVIFRGQMNPDNIFEAICSGFTHATRLHQMDGERRNH